MVIVIQKHLLYGIKFHLHMALELQRLHLAYITVIYIIKLFIIGINLNLFIYN